MTRFLLRTAQSILLFSTYCSASLCPRPSRNQPVDFSYYMLSMSYSPTFCKTHSNAAGTRQCNGNYGLILHGLWPNYDHGYPQNCPSDFNPTNQDLMDALNAIPDWQDIAPEYDDLIVHEWCKHGTCSGLSPQDYLELAFSEARKYADSAALSCSQAQQKFPDAQSIQGCNGNQGTVQEVRFRVEKDSSENSRSRRMTSFVNLDGSSIKDTPKDYNNLPIYFDPIMSVADAWDVADGLYLCIKNNNSVFLWVNDNFARLVGSTKEALIGTRDSREEHVAADKETLASGVPLLNYHETISVPTGRGDMQDIEIVTQKGLLREKGGKRIIGITVAFHKLEPDPSRQAKDLIKQHSMVPTGVGGYTASGPSSDIVISKEALPARFVEDTKLYSTNYFLLEHNENLVLHMLNQDEQWFFHTGNSIVIHVFNANTGAYHNVTIGENKGEVLQYSVPHNTWFGAQVNGLGFAFVSCSLAPGWVKSDSFTPSSEQVHKLKEQFPSHGSLINALSIMHK